MVAAKEMVRTSSRNLDNACETDRSFIPVNVLLYFLAAAARLREQQKLMNKVIKSFASSIPEHLYYTALPQLISCVLHNNAESAKNVALILTTVLAKYPQQAMWSCGWLRFSKSEEKKKTGEVRIAYIT